ncbi:cysteine hydrolase [Mucilaginibacter sp. BJC16-A38]|uniref:cysteine hydrolase family protein n=1 Tax=Mucilaginibacter phenanthrenivorans TaxID=1234842 RepID=UPI0021578BDB|nr:isochorismatase family cysteine hydrolase [Mucilaginibacter phenanthrenivorans]MCR8559001.1 cysteine hydrolase [Mucilaginibacter phenanthrenivorans]
MQQNTALLVMDMQAAVLAGLADPKPLLSNIATAVTHARNNNIPVIYVVVGFRTGAPEISTRNKMFGGMRERSSGINMEEMLKVHPDLAPATNEIIVVKRRVSAFTGSDLEVILRAQGIQHLILTGMAASGVVLSTLREAADKDYRITILEDCCGDRDDEVKGILMAKVFVQQADVLKLNEWIKVNS